jgi:hypothetical protein
MRETTTIPSGMNERVAFTLRLLAAAGVLSIAGCVHHSRHPHDGPPGHHPDGPPGHREPVRAEPVRTTTVTVVDDDSHSCHDDCDHHWDGVRFVVVSGHRHGHACGHERSGNRWVIARVAVRSDDDSHSCHDECDHHWDGVRFVVTTGHRHGHDCGHERQGNRWVVARVVVKPGNNGNGNGRGNGRGR